MRLSALLERTKPGTYAGVRFSKSTCDQIEALQQQLGVPNPLSAKEFHTTLLYSKKNLPNYEAAGKLNPIPVSDTTEFDLVIWPSGSGTKNVLVLKYKCSWLENRHTQLSDEHGAKWSFDDYIPHITLSYDIGDWKPDSKKVTLDAPIEIVKEYSEELDPDW